MAITMIGRRTASLLAVAWPLGMGCNELLTAKNFNQPDVERIFAEPLVVEQAIASGFKECHNNTISMRANGSSAGVQPQLMVLAFEEAVNVGEGAWGMGIREAIPRAPILNSGTDEIANKFNFVNFNGLSRLSRFTSWALAALDRLERDGRSLGTHAQDLRARAFGFFAVSCALGNLALVYDSAAVVSPELPNDSIPPLTSAAEVMRAALAMMDSAIAIANRPEAEGAGGFPLPAGWVGSEGKSREEFVRFVRSWRARFRAGVARTPAERAAVDWTKVIADADFGILRDVTVRVGGTTGWEAGYGRFLRSNGGANQMAPFYIGMADVSGAYDAWLATPLEERRSILIVSPDRRFPQGSTSTEQQVNSVVATDYLSLPLLFHRTELLARNDPWSSFYSLTRFAYLAPAGGVGVFPIMLRAEMDLLMAEGYIRLNRLAEAAARIDITRVGRGQLPPITGAISSLTDPVPGGANCVPRVPAPPDFSSTRCGNILEAMKWEKRLETAFIGFGAWFMDSRGWGDLIEGSPLEWPVPFQELQVRKKPFYSLGGGGPSSARRGTYGF